MYKLNVMKICIKFDILQKCLLQLTLQNILMTRF